jgi:hypothetical protein
MLEHQRQLAPGGLPLSSGLRPARPKSRRQTPLAVGDSLLSEFLENNSPPD